MDTNPGGTSESTSPAVTAFQLQILKAIPAANPKAKKPVRCLPFFVLRKILHIETPRSVHNFASALKSLIYKGYLIKDEGKNYCITDEGIRAVRAGFKPAPTEGDAKDKVGQETRPHETAPHD